jgi:hypothetical protein
MEPRHDEGHREIPRLEIGKIDQTPASYSQKRFIGSLSAECRTERPDKCFEQLRTTRV